MSNEMPAAPPPPEIRARFAEELKAIRMKRGFVTARSFAAKIDIDEIRLMRYERAEVEPDFTTLARICKALDVTPNDLLGFSD